MPLNAEEGQDLMAKFEAMIQLEKEIAARY